MSHIRHLQDSYETSLKQKKWVGSNAQEVRLRFAVAGCVDSDDLYPSDLSLELHGIVLVVLPYGLQNRFQTLILNKSPVDDSPSL